MSQTTPPEADVPRPRGRAASRQIIVTVAFTFCAYLTVGMPLGVLPPFVHQTLGFSAVLAGLAVSVQYLATVVTRAPVGRMTDTVGPKKMVLFGLCFCTASGLFTMLGALARPHPTLSLALLLIGRLCLGAGESGVSTGCLTWAIGRVGPMHSARIISWNGIATYGGIALGAPLGVVIQSVAGFWSLGLVMAAIALIALPVAARGPVTRLVRGPQLPFRSVLGRVLPHGIAIALGSIGFGAIASFVTLFYAGRGWGHAALALSAFGGFFILSRLLLVSSIARIGALRMAMLCFLAEGAGLLVLGVAWSPAIAIIGAALTGFGFGPIFPALGIEALERVPATSRGAALGVFSVFLDLALGVTGPAAGFIQASFGYSAIYLFAAAAAVAGGGIMIALGGMVRPTPRLP
ncbi:MFS transporter [Acidisoma cladoniae]|uniref:MFS transporter n=1 Tax=Acidisoma cladoniae TaxID=3040935 RepID=UPI00254CC49C|nr:MFS transporter [Acidisoma sp. PAMC 29798]